MEGEAVISPDAYQIRDRQTGRYLQREIIDGKPTPVVWGWVFHADPCWAGAWPRGHVDLFLGDRRPPELQGTGFDLELVPAPACGCCGEIERGVVGGRWQITLRRFNIDGETHWRCEKHVGRNPCCIEGCGKTFAHKDGADYETRFMCGRCWRQAPKWMRDRESKLRRLAKRRGWPERHHRLHHMAWEACRRWIERARNGEGAEVEVSSTPPPAGMMVELQRLGL
jgi:hypothetical protein